MKGKLIVIDGVDGSGKSTQAKLTAEKLAANGIDSRLISFPRYDAEYSAPVRMYLGGDFGTNPDDVNAYAASCFYAVDRYCSYKTEWGKDLENGSMLVSARYTSSNAIHQGTKMSKEKAKDYFEWLKDFEYGKLGLPVPDVVIFLDMPPEKGLALVESRYGGDETKKDIHEKDREYIFKCYETAKYAAETLGWKTVHCVDKDGNVRTVEDINAEIMALIL